MEFTLFEVLRHHTTWRLALERAFFYSIEVVRTKTARMSRDDQNFKIRSKHGGWRGKSIKNIMQN